MHASTLWWGRRRVILVSNKYRKLFSNPGARKEKRERKKRRKPCQSVKTTACAANAVFIIVSNLQTQQ